MSLSKLKNTILAKDAGIKRYTVFVKPRSRKPRVEKIEDDSFEVYTSSPPHEGKANEELLKRLSSFLSIPPSRIAIKSGLKSRKKIIEIF